MMLRDLNKLSQDIFNISHHEEFNGMALEIFHLQYKNNMVYRHYCDLINTNISEIRSYEDIPFLPVELFKTHRIATVAGTPEFKFFSSGTTAGNKSTHLVFNADLYRRSILNGFRFFYGEPQAYCFIMLIPTDSYHPNSSLVFMADYLIEQSRCPESGYYLGREKLIQEIIREVNGLKIFVLGLSYALADLAEKRLCYIPDAVVMETGGMKGKRTEMTRDELHSLICEGTGVRSVHSEYSMCELFSQAYSKEDGYFSSPPWMKILIRETNDPFTLAGMGKTGIVNIADLANINTCSFIETQDLGRIHRNGEFEILGRIDHSELRGCSLMTP